MNIGPIEILDCKPRLPDEATMDVHSASLGRTHSYRTHTELLFVENKW